MSDAPPGRGRFLADIFVVAAYELQQARRTRLLQVGLLLYAAGTAAADWGFVQALREAERSVAQAMHVPATEKPGTLIAEVLKSDDLRDFLGGLIGSTELFDRLATEPVLGLWSGAVAMVLLPLLLLLGTSVSVSAEVESRSIRFLALRTERVPIVLGKLLGQVAMAGLAALVGVLVTEIIGQTLMVQVPIVGLALSSTRRAACALAYALPFAGLGLCVSQWIGRSNPARVVAVVFLLAILVLGEWPPADWLPDWIAPGLEVLRGFLPGRGWDEAWTDDPLAFAMGLARYALNTLAWVGLGYLRFDRRDL